VDAVHQLDAGDRDHRVTERLEAEHYCNVLLDAPIVQFNRVIQVSRRALLRVRWQRAIGFQLAHRAGTLRSRPGDRLWWALVALDREGLGSSDVATGAQPEVDGPPHPINGTV
jgi:hypothetical protein